MAYKFLDDGFLGLGTGSTTNALLRLQDISLSYNVNNIEVTALDTNFETEYLPTTKSWSVSCSGYFTDYDITAFSGSSKSDVKIDGALNGEQLLEEIKKRNTKNKITLKLNEGNYQTGNVILTSFEVTGSVGEIATYSLEMQGVGALEKVTV